jgi:MFS family permease
MMSGIVKMGSGVGIMTVPLVATWLISAYEWRTSYIIIGITLFILVVLGSQLLRRDPAQMHQFPDGLTVLVHIVPRVIDLGFSASFGATMLAVIGGASIIGRFAMGITADKIGSKGALLICLLTLITALAWLQFAEDLWMLLLFAFIHGFSHGGFFVLISSTVAEFFGTQSHGSILGIVIFSGSIGGSLGPLIAGRIFDTTGSYSIAFLLLLSLASIGFILVLSLRQYNEK